MPNSRSALLRSPACRNVQARFWVDATGEPPKSGGIDGSMKSGYAGTVTTGNGMVFGAQALTITSDANTSRRMRSTLYRAPVEPSEQPPRHVRDDHHPSIARLVLDDLRMPIHSRDPLPVRPIV